MTDIGVSFQAIKEAEVDTNVEKNTKGMITFTDTKIMLGLGNTTLDYLTLLKAEIEKNLPTTPTEPGITDIPPIYRGTQPRTEIEANLDTWKNSIVFDETNSKLYYIKKEFLDTDDTFELKTLEIPMTNINVNYAERYVAGTNITITDNDDGTKSINATSTAFTGFNVVETLPDPQTLLDEANVNKVYFVL